MSLVTHRCQFCDADYPCDTFREGEDEQGHDVSACDCPKTSTCPDCADPPPVDEIDQVRR